jgi:hypothetical protein
VLSGCGLGGDISCLGRYREATAKKRRRNPSDSPSVVVYSTVSMRFVPGQFCVPGNVPARLSFISHDARAAVAVVEVVAESYHTAGTRVVGADSAEVVAAAGIGDGLYAFCAS